MPAAGKTRFAHWLSGEIRIPLLSLDEIWEKAGTSVIPFAQYWVLCEDIMKSTSSFIIEFGFDDEIKPAISALIKKYNYQTVNIHFDTSFEIAHRRFNERRLHEMDGSKPQISLEQYTSIATQDKNFRFGNSVIYVDTDRKSVV